MQPPADTFDWNEAAGRHLERPGARVNNAAAKIRILLVHEHLLFREALKRLLECEPDFELTALCGTVSEALEALGRHHIDVALLDLDPGDEIGLGFLWAARDRGFRGQI